MKFAFSTAACPTWDLPAVISRAAAWGYDGVELHSRAGSAGPPRADPWTADPELVRAAFAAAGLSIACLCDPSHATVKLDQRALPTVREQIDLAARLGCGVVRLFDVWGTTRQSDDALALQMGDWLQPLADHTASRGVTLVVENAVRFARSRQMWGLLDRLAHPGVACAWDVLRSTQAGETPGVSVPTLNAKIAYARAADALLTPAGAISCDFGDGDVPVREFLTALRGVGYRGFVAVGWEKGWSVDPEAALPDALAKLRKWSAAPAMAGKQAVGAK